MELYEMDEVDEGKRRQKPRLSVAARRDLKKKSSSQGLRMVESPLQQQQQRSGVDSLSNTAQISSMLDSSDGEQDQAPKVVAKKNSNLDVAVSRQLSDSSNFLAKKCLDTLEDEDGIRVQRALLLVSKAHRAGMLSVKEKAELKDILVSNGSLAMVNHFAKFPGSASFMKWAIVSPSIPQKEYDPLASSRYHVFRNLTGYSVTMFVNEARKMEHALLHGNQHCSVVSHFVAIEPSKIAEGLHAGTKQVLREPNAGGKSFNSEALSFETLQALFGSTDLMTEMSVRYQRRHTPIVDFLCTIMGHRVGVSVTRAMHFLGESHFHELEAQTLLKKKLAGLDGASEGICDDLKFDRQILHVWAQSERICKLVKAEFDSMDWSDRRNPTICLITVCTRLDDSFIFQNHVELDPSKRPDPLWHEEMRRRLKREDSDFLFKQKIKHHEKQDQVESALRRVSLATKLL